MARLGRLAAGLKPRPSPALSDEYDPRTMVGGPQGLVVAEDLVTLRHRASGAPRMAKPDPRTLPPASFDSLAAPCRDLPGTIQVDERQASRSERDYGDERVIA